MACRAVVIWATQSHEKLQEKSGDSLVSWSQISQEQRRGSFLSAVCPHRTCSCSSLGQLGCHLQAVVVILCVHVPVCLCAWEGGRKCQRRWETGMDASAAKRSISAPVSGHPNDGGGVYVWDVCVRVCVGGVCGWGGPRLGEVGALLLGILQLQLRGLAAAVSTGVCRWGSRGGRDTNGLPGGFKAEGPGAQKVAVQGGACGRRVCTPPCRPQLTGGSAVGAEGADLQRGAM